MLERYLFCLFKQYCDARGLDINNMNNIYSNDFGDWIVQNKILLSNYMDYLNILGFDYPVDDVVEVGKGKYDSLFQYGVNLISMFAWTLGKVNSRLFIDRGMPLILRQGGIEPSREHIILTHNPYFESEILNWYLIHNRGDKNISIGMFGKLSDEDTKRNVELLKKLSKLMTGDYSFDYDTNNGSYFCSLNSERYVKRKILTKTR